jgi:hypothetical protein
VLTLPCSEERKASSAVQHWYGGRISRPWSPPDIRSLGMNSSRLSRSITFLKVSWIGRWRSCLL